MQSYLLVPLRVWAQTRNQEKNKPSEVILWAEVSNKTWFFVNGALCLTGVPELKVFSQLQHLCGQMSAPTPVAGSQDVALGLGSEGDAVVGCVGLGVSPATHLPLQSMQKMNYLWNIFHWVISDSSQVKGRRYEDAWMQTHMLWLQEWCFFPICVIFLTAIHVYLCVTDLGGGDDA